MNAPIVSTTRTVKIVQEPLPVETPRRGSLRKVLLYCGIASSLWYIVINIIVPLSYPGYSFSSQVVSELSAIGAPTRSLWVSLCIPYSLLLIAFGWGIWLSAGTSRVLRIVAVAFILDAVIGIFWTPMHSREVLAAGGATISDTLHIVFTAVWGVFVMLAMGFGAAAFGRRFHLFTVATWVLLAGFGVLTGLSAPELQAGKATPGIGIWERINIGLFMLWVMVFAWKLLRRDSRVTATGGILAKIQ